MDDLIKNSINSRKDSIFNAYDVKDAKLLKEIDELFNKMNDLGKTCSDLMDFESKLASSPLNQEYIELFSKIAQSSNSLLKDPDTVASESNYSGGLNEEIESELKYRVDDLTLPARRIAREETEKKLRNTPIIGDVMNIKQHLDLFGCFRRKKKAKE